MTAAAARFAGQWAAVAPQGRVGLAVSGGPDSMAMLLLFHEVAPRNFSVVTVDHGLRPEAADEAAMVAAVCATRGIPHRILTLSLQKGAAVQERARAARYAAMADWAETEGLAGLVTAHHADDQAETMVMRLNRGAGLRGLAGMRPIARVPGAAGLPLLRPLLEWRRAELAAVVQLAGIEAALDPSNSDATYERVRVRDGLTSSKLLEINGLAASARHLAEADTALEWMAEQLWSAVDREGEALVWNPPPDLPDALAMRVLERVLAQFGGARPRGAELVRWLAALVAGGVATLGGVKGDARRGQWRFTPAPGRKWSALGTGR